MTKFDNLRLGSKLALLMLVVIACVAGGVVAVDTLVQRELLASRINELRAITDITYNFAAELQKQVDAGETTREAAIATFFRRVRNVTYDNGQGYLFVYRMDGTVLYNVNSSLIGTNVIDTVCNGHKSIRELRDAVRAQESATVYYDFPRAGETVATP